MTENYLLTENEVKDLPNGQCVWVEEHPESFLNGGISRVFRDADCVLLVDAYGTHYEVSIPGWNIFLNREDVRVWALPQEPSEWELAANPWPKSAGCLRSSESARLLQ